ncbi:hypothetical protein PG994_013678 [Apiospora phragmitis]|uniref:Uncharacterized protein n=1 Tax=Apiospora phragmitis TaxID=2905665 RepID=A0ABR1T9C5_9PEZI
MAEPLGIVASGIAVAQLGVAAGVAVWKLRQLWGEVQDVPEVISDLIERIDLIYPSVWDFERHAGEARRCRRGPVGANHLAAGISTEVGGSQSGPQEERVKKAGGAIEELIRGPASRTGCLHWHTAQHTIQHTAQHTIQQTAQQTIQHSCTTTVLSFEVKASTRVPSGQESGQKCPPAGSRSAYHVQRRAASGWKPLPSFGTLSLHIGPGEYGADFRPPWWLTGFASSFSFHMSRYRSTWDAHLRVYSERLKNEPIFWMAAEGDMAGLLSLFDQRKASPSIEMKMA